MSRSFYIQKLICNCSECPLLKKEKQHKQRHKKRPKARNNEQKANSSCTREGDCMRSRGLNQDAPQDVPRTQRNKRHRTRHKDAVQEGTRGESHRMAQCNI